MPPPAPKTYAPMQSYASDQKPKIVESFGKGLMADIKGKAPFLVSDITDGFSIKVGYSRSVSVISPTQLEFV